MNKKVTAMNRLQNFIYGTILGAIVIGCTPYYVSSNFDERTSGHQSVAILPFEMHFTGVYPERLTEADILLLEEAESRAFQIAFFNELLRTTKGGKKAMRVDVQDHNKTVRLLDQQNIGIRESWARPPEALADLLGVDAVVRARVEKARFMSDLESYGIEVATEVVTVLTNNVLFPQLPPFSNQSKAIVADYGLYGRDEGTLLWSIAFDKGADWRRPAEEIIDEISRTAARKFPYRR